MTIWPLEFRNKLEAAHTSLVSDGLPLDPCTCEECCLAHPARRLVLIRQRARLKQMFDHLDEYYPLPGV